MKGNAVHMYQKEQEFRMAVERIGINEAARQLYAEWQQRQKYGLDTEHEATQNMIRIELLSKGIY